MTPALVVHTPLGLAPSGPRARTDAAPEGARAGDDGNRCIYCINPRSIIQVLTELRTYGCKGFLQISAANTPSIAVIPASISATGINAKAPRIYAIFEIAPKSLSGREIREFLLFIQ